MDVKFWGPGLWKSLFTIASNYPLKIDKNNRLHVCKKRYYKSFFISLKNTLPCKYCRISYKKFLKELPITPFLDSRTRIMYWLYLIKDKVNKKLIAQEKINKTKTFKTKPSPPFEEVCKYYEKYRAKCSQKTKTCRTPVKGSS